MALSTSAFQEPRGVMRIIQFVFAIWAFATVSDYSNSIEVKYCDPTVETHIFNFGYPFKLDRIIASLKCNETTVDFNLIGDYSHDSQYFVATGVLSFLYCIGIVVVYAFFENVYQSNALVPMADFILTVLLAVFWLSGSAAWSNGIAGLKSSSDPQSILRSDKCVALRCTSILINGGYSSLNISAILGFLNFFLWASNLWFLYKETQWFKNTNLPPTQSSPTSLA